MLRSSGFVPCLLAALVLGCTWDSYVPRGRPIELPATAPAGIRPLELCQPVSEVIDCRGRETQCNHWYRVDVLQPGELRVRVRFGEAKGEGELARLVVRPMGKALLGQQVTTRDEPLAVTAAVTPDVYGVLVQGAGSQRAYTLWAAVVQPGTPESESCPTASEIAPPDA